MDDAADRRGRVTEVLDRIREGDAAAAERLIPLVYDELRLIARGRMARERHRTLQPTELVHEALLQLGDPAQASWQNRAHFFGAAATAMRRILVERARARSAAKRGGGQPAVELLEEMAIEEPPSDEMLALDEALERLEQRDAQMAEIVKLRYFTGLSIAEIARVLEISPRSVDRGWSAARAWLHAEIERR